MSRENEEDSGSELCRIIPPNECEGTVCDHPNDKVKAITSVVNYCTKCDRFI